MFHLTGADAVVLFLLQGTNERLKENLEKSLRPSAQVDSHAYSTGGSTAVALNKRHGIFVYEIGNTGEEVKTDFFSG
jgi:hypothetical protein